jgi:ribose transport system substrate-binding protein
MAAATVAFAGCSSSKNNAGTTSSTTAGSSGTTASSSGGVSSSVASTVSQFEGSPNLGLNPLSATPPTGKSLVYLANTNAPTDVMNGQAATAAAQLLGWHMKTIGYAGDPATLATALGEAVAQKPDGVLISGQDSAAFSSALQKADQAGVPVFVGGVPDTATGMSAGGLEGVSLGPNFLATEGKISADWIIKDSGAKANVAIVTLPAFNTLVAEDKGFSDELTAQCPSCTYTTVNAQLTDIGKDLPQLVVSAVQAKTSINYLFFPYGDTAVGVPPALKTAGFSPKVVAAIADSLTYSALKSGTFAMNVATSPQVQGFLEVDLAARYFDTHQPSTDDVPELQILDSTNDSSATLPVVPPDYESQFKTLWHIS